MMIHSGLLSRILSVGFASLVLAGAYAAPLRAQTCSKNDFAAAVDAAGSSLRRFNAEANPRLQKKLKLLREKKGWPESDYEEKGFDYLQDGRMTALDTEANDLLSKVDELGRLEGAAADCPKLAELKSAGDQLLSVMKTKSEYTIGKIDSELGNAAPPAKAAAKSKPPAAPPVATVKPGPGAARENWDTTTSLEPGHVTRKDQQGAPYALPPDAFITDERGYTIDEIREASRGFFGTISTSLASVIEHAFAKSGRPTAYVLGNEGGGAFLAGLRYGSGTLYLRAGGTQKVYWHGPSIGGDIGAEGARTLYLIYGLKEPSALFRSYAGIDGTAYLVGGFGMTFLKGGDVIMAPIRSGIGLRLGASIGYVRFTPTQTWNPF